MSSLVDLTKKVAVILEKKEISNARAQVGFAVDVSGSMRTLYANGTMQEVVNRIQALANKFDDNQSLDMWIFDNGSKELSPATPEMFGNYVENHILTNSSISGGTDFMPVLSDVADHYFPRPKGIGFLSKLLSSKAEEPISADPVYLIFLTDGENSDQVASAKLVGELNGENIYIQFVGLGKDANFTFIKKLAKEFDHVGFVDFSHPETTTDDQMFEALLNDKFINWVKNEQ